MKPQPECLLSLAPMEKPAPQTPVRSWPHQGRLDRACSVPPTFSKHSAGVAGLLHTYQHRRRAQEGSGQGAGAQISPICWSQTPPFLCSS